MSNFLKGNSILIVDDNDLIVSLEELRTYKGFDIIGTEHDENDAISLYKELIPNLVLLDVRMPNKNGFEDLEEIKKLM